MPARLSRSWKSGLLLAIVTLAGGGAVAGWRQLPVTVIAAAVDRGDVVQSVSGMATVESQSEIPLAFEAPGRIVSLAVQEGDTVRAGQLLASLDTADMQQQLAVAEANHAVSAAAIAKSAADLDRATATRERAAQDHARKADLFAQGAISVADRDLATERLAVAQADVKAVTATAGQARKAQTAARQLVAVQQTGLAHARLLSPMAGLVVRRHREPGEVVTPGLPVVTVVSLQQLWARTWIDESALGRVTPGQTAGIRFLSMPEKPFPGRVDRLGQQVDRQTHELLVDVTILARPQPLALGQRADVTIETARRRGVVRLPRAFYDTATASVVAVRDGRTVSLPVTAGLIGTTHLEIRQGLQPGDRVVRSPKAGQRVPSGRKVTVTAPS